MLNLPTYRGMNGLGEGTPSPIVAVVPTTRPTEPLTTVVSTYVPPTDEEYAREQAISADKTMSMIVRFPGMLLAGIGQWALNRTRSEANFVDPLRFATDDKNKNLTWALALVAWGGIGWGVYSLFFKKGGS